MDFADVVRRRRMVRRYQSDRAVDPAVLDRLFAVATRAPSAGFTQAVEFLVLRTTMDRERFWHTQVAEPTAAEPSPWLAGMRTAPVLVVVTTSERAYVERYAAPDKAHGGGPGRSWTAPYWDVDAGMSAMLLLLAAVDEGLGACFFGLTGPATEARLKTQFGLPSERSCVGVISLGYPALDAAPAGSPTRRPRKPTTESVHDGLW